MRLIDADACREDFMQEVYAELESDPDNVRANRIIDLFDMMPTIESPRDWTPCSVGLPEKLGIYNVTVQYPSGDRAVYRDTFRPKFGWNSDVYTERRVVAWTHKIEPYRGGE